MITPFTNDCLHPDSPLKSADAIKMLVAMGVPLEFRFPDIPQWSWAYPSWFTHPNADWHMSTPMLIRRAP